MKAMSLRGQLGEVEAAIENGDTTSDRCAPHTRRRGCVTRASPPALKPSTSTAFRLATGERRCLEPGLTKLAEQILGRLQGYSGESLGMVDVKGKVTSSSFVSVASSIAEVKRRYPNTGLTPRSTLAQAALPQPAA